MREEHLFRDDGYSGASLHRPGLDRLRDAVAAAPRDRVLLTAPDRLARTSVHQMLLLDELQRQGCQIEFLERPMSQDPHDQLLLPIRGAVASSERTRIAERMRRGRLRKRQAGVLLPWTRAPDGHRLDPEPPRDPAGVRVAEAAAVVVRELFAPDLEPGGSRAGRAKRLYTLEVRTPSGKRCWHPNPVRLLLTTPTSTGQVYSGRSRPRVARGRWSAWRPVRPGSSCDEPLPPAAWFPVAPVPALVSQEQYDQVQAKSRPNSPTPSNSPGATTPPIPLCCARWSAAASARCAASGAPAIAIARPTPIPNAAGRRTQCSSPAASRSARPASSLPPSSTTWSGPTCAPCCCIPPVSLRR